jgi:hypothetical protein
MMPSPYISLDKELLDSTIINHYGIVSRTSSVRCWSIQESFASSRDHSFQVGSDISRLNKCAYNE